MVLVGGDGGFELHGGSIFGQSRLCFMFPVLRANLVSRGNGLAATRTVHARNNGAGRCAVVVSCHLALSWV